MASEKKYIVTLTYLLFTVDILIDQDLEKLAHLKEDLKIKLGVDFSISSVKSALIEKED